MKTLTLEKRGCDFSPTDEINALSDVGNHRIGIYDKSIHCINGRDYILEFTQGTRYKTRTTNKRTGAPLLHPVREIINANALWLNTEYEGKHGDHEGCWRDSTLEKVIHEMNLSYTRADILRVVNMISETKYDNLEIK